MDLTYISHGWTWTRIFTAVVVPTILLKITSFLWRGYKIRARFRELESQGITIPAGHSLLFGHILMVLRLRTGLPGDANDTYANRRLVLNWREHFPGAAACPPVIYLDLWPLLDEAAAIVNDANLCQAVVQDRYPPRHATAKYLQSFISGDRNLSAWGGSMHRMWRSRVNPGFSTRNLQSFMPALVQEVSIFASRLRDTCGSKDPADGGEQWGAVFPLLPLAIDLTFDVICRIVLDFSPGEQTNGPTDFQQSFGILGLHQTVKSLRSLPRRLNPLWHLEAWRCQRTLRRILLPHIQRHLHETTDSSVTKPSAQKTVVHLAIRQFQDDQQNHATPDPEFIGDILGLTKQFIFAGRNTTAITLSFAIHQIYTHPDVLAKMRAEHDAILGPNPQDASALLIKSPHLLQALPYTLAAIKETLRLYPLASNIRQGSADFTLAHDGGGGSVRYPTAGCVLIPAIETLHYHPDIWPRVEDFLPDRWVVAEGHPLHMGPATRHAWRPFEQGPMACIGMELALMELRLALVFTVREMDVECAWDEWDSLQGSDTTNPKKVNGDRVYQTKSAVGGPPTDGLPVHVRLRKAL